MPKNKWGRYKLQNCSVSVPLDRLASYLHTALNESLLLSQGLSLLVFFPFVILFFQSLINADIFLSLWGKGPHPQMFLVFEHHKYQNLIQRKEYESWCSLSPGRWRFLEILVSDTKISKLTLCFSILLFKINCWDEKILRWLRRDDILKSWINTQQKWSIRYAN